jgi:hypothetical protein
MQLFLLADRGGAPVFLALWRARFDVHVHMMMIARRVNSTLSIKLHLRLAAGVVLVGLPALWAPAAVVPALIRPAADARRAFLLAPGAAGGERNAAA